MKNTFTLFFALLCMALPAMAGTVTGQIQAPSTGRGVANGTLTFTLSQAAVVSGTATLAGNGTCWTDSTGNIVGLPGDGAVAAPVLSSNLGSGSLGSGTYFVRTTWANATGESQPSAERSLALGSSGTLIVQAPVNVPALATSMKVYIGSASGGETLQGSVAVTGGVIAGNYNQATPLVNGAALPASNTSLCQVRFNDELQPSFTAYSVALTNSSGAGIAGFPQKWYLSGGSNGTVNVSNGTPLYAGVVQYPQAIVSNPTANGTQSINGGLNLNGFSLSNLGTETVKNLNGIRFADQYSGADWCAKANAADSDITLSGATCGMIYIPSSLSGGSCTTVNFSPSACRTVVFGGGNFTLTGFSIVPNNQTHFAGAGIGVTTLVQGATGTNLFSSSSAADVEIDHFTLAGIPGTSATSANSAIFAGNTAAGNLSRWNIHDIRATGWRYNAVYGQNVAGFNVKNSFFDNNAASCVRGSGVIGFEWTGNTCQNPSTTTFNIGFMIDSTDPINGTSYPVSTDGVIANNTVLNLVKWYGIELHSGQRITISDNQESNVMAGVLVVPFNGTDTTSDVTISGNTIVGQSSQDTTCSDGNDGILVAGGGVGIATPVNVTVTGNEVSNANAALRSAFEGGINIGTSTTVNVSGNVVKGGYGAGISIVGTTNPASDVDIFNNSISGVQVATNTGGYCGDGNTAAGIYASGPVAPTGWIAHNHIDNTTWGIRSDVTALSMLVSINDFTSVSTLYPGPTLSNLTFDVVAKSNLPLGLNGDTCFSRAAVAQFDFGTCTQGDTSGLIYASRFRIPNSARYETNLMRVGSGGVFAWASTADGENGASDTSLTRPNADEVACGNGSAGDKSCQFDTTILQIQATAFASLGSPINGTIKYCSDCTIANPCAGGGTGALAKRLNGAWVCN